MSGPTPAGEPDARVAAMAAQPGQRGRASRMADRVNERGALDQLIGAVRADEGRALVVRGEAGVGKTVLLEYLAVRATGLGLSGGARDGRAIRDGAGVRGTASAVRADAGSGGGVACAAAGRLRIALGLTAGPPPDRFLWDSPPSTCCRVWQVEHPLICLIDDEQWLDQVSGAGTGVRGSAGWRPIR